MSKDITNNRLRLILVIAPILIGTAAYVGAGIYDEFHSKNYSQLTSTSSSEQEGVSDAFSWVHSARHNRWRSFRATAPKGATFSDPLTGLEWMRCSLGQNWTGTDCEGQPFEMNLIAAEESAEKLDFDNKRDWRLPTVYELSTLVYCSSGTRQRIATDDSGKIIQEGSDGDFLNGICLDKYDQPTINSLVFPSTAQWPYWTSTPYLTGESSAWVVYFNWGLVGVYEKQNQGHVRLVRNK